MKNFMKMTMRLMMAALLVLATFPAFAAVDITAKGKSFIQDLVDVAQFSKGSSGVVSDEARQKIKKVSEQIDFQSLAKSALGKRWATFKATERSDFLAVLQELLETVAYPKAKKMSAQLADMEFKKVGPNQVKVSGTLNREKRGEIISEKFNLGLIFNAAGTKIVDAIIEDEKVSANLNRQFTEALKKKTFAEIITQMKKRVSDAKAKHDSAA